MTDIGGLDAGNSVNTELVQLSPGHEPDGLDRAVTVRRMRGHIAFEWGGLGSPTSADMAWLSVVAAKGQYRSATESRQTLDLGEIANATPFATAAMEVTQVYGPFVASGGEGKPVVFPFDIKRQWKLRRGQSLYLYAVGEAVHTSSGGIPANTNFRTSINLRALLSDAGA